MGKSVYDIGVLLDALVPDPTSYLDDLGKDTAELKIATLNQREHPLTPEEHDLYHAAIAALGENLQRDPVRVDVLQEMIESEAIETLWAAYSQGVWAEYLAHVDGGDIKTLAQLVDWHDSHPVSPVTLDTARYGGARLKLTRMPGRIVPPETSRSRIPEARSEVSRRPE